MNQSFMAARKKFHRPRKVLDADADGLATFLRAIYPHDTAANVAADLHVTTRTVANWLGGDASPRLTHFIRMIDCYGPSAIAAAYPSAPAWVSDAVRAERMAQLEAELAALRGERECL